MLTRLNHWLVKQKKALLAIGSYGLTFTSPLAAVYADQLRESAKSSGTEVIELFIIIALVLSAISLALGLVMHASGVQFLAQSGTKRILVGGGVVVGILLLSIFFTWLITTMKKSGGGTLWNGFNALN